MIFFNNYTVTGYKDSESERHKKTYSITVLNGAILFIDEYNRRIACDATFKYSEAIAYAYDGKYNCAFYISDNNYIYCKLNHRQIWIVKFINNLLWIQKWDNLKWLISIILSFGSGFALKWWFGC